MDEDDRVSLALLNVRQFRPVDVNRVRLRTLVHDGTLLGVLARLRESDRPIFLRVSRDRVKSTWPGTQL